MVIKHLHSPSNILYHDVIVKIKIFPKRYIYWTNNNSSLFYELKWRFLSSSLHKVFQDLHPSVILIFSYFQIWSSQAPPSVICSSHSLFVQNLYFHLVLIQGQGKTNMDYIQILILKRVSGKKKNPVIMYVFLVLLFHNDTHTSWLIIKHCMKYGNLLLRMTQ